MMKIADMGFGRVKVNENGVKNKKKGKKKKTDVENLINDVTTL